MTYVLLAFMLATAIVYFMVASQEYSDLLEFQQVGIDGETQEKQVEMTLFIGSGLTYIGLFAWTLGAKLKKYNSIYSDSRSICHFDCNLYSIQNNRCPNCRGGVLRRQDGYGQ